MVFSGGSAPDSRVAAMLPAERFVIAADGGHRFAQDLGLLVDVLVGDFDSLATSDLEAAELSDTEIVRHRVDKDATDLELALDLAIERGPREVIVVGGGEGERLDHFVGMLSLLGDPRYSEAKVSAWLGHSRVVVVRPGQPATFERAADNTADTTSTYLSLIPITDAVDGVTTAGLRFALDNDTLLRHRTRGVSNEFAEPTAGALATVSITSGALLVVQPAALPPLASPASKSSTPKASL